MRREFEMSEEQLQTIISASQSVRYLVAGGMPPSSPQENANRAWADLGREMGFDYMTVEPTGKGIRFFTAEETKKEAA